MHWNQYSSHHLSLNSALSGNQPAASWAVPGKLSIISEAYDSPENWSLSSLWIILSPSVTKRSCLRLPLAALALLAHWVRVAQPKERTFQAFPFNLLSPELVHSDKEALSTWLLWGCCNRALQTAWLKQTKNIELLTYGSEDEKLEISVSAKLDLSGHKEESILYLFLSSCLRYLLALRCYFFMSSHHILCVPISQFSLFIKPHVTLDYSIVQ